MQAMTTSFNMYREGVPRHQRPGRHADRRGLYAELFEVVLLPQTGILQDGTTKS